MRRNKIVLDYTRFAVTVLIEFARNTVTMMSGNASFQTPDVALAVINQAVLTLETAYNASRSGDKQRLAVMNQARKVLTDLLYRQALYVERITIGNGAVALSSGFHVSKNIAPAASNDFLVKTGKHSGEVILKHKLIKGTKAWIWELCNDPIQDGNWKVVGHSTQTKFVVAGLTPGAKYWFRCAGITKDGVSSWCDPAFKIAV